VEATAEPSPDRPAVIGVQSLLYQTPISAIERMLDALDNSSRVGLYEGWNNGFIVTLGDGSPQRLLSEDDLERLRERCPRIHQLRYHWFATNVGTSRGHNELALIHEEPEYLIFANPDVVCEPRAIWRMLAVFNDPQVGFVEAKQLPIEHPKDYFSTTGFTSWATTAFAMTPRDLFLDLDGFDAESFFMYCDDVDYSWRVRETGRTVVFQPGAVVFHDKYLSTEGGWMPTNAEVRYSAQAALFLAHKWSKPGLVKRILTNFEKSDRPPYKAAAAEFRRRKEAGELVEPRDPDHKVGEFVGIHYAEHRYPL
jgi:GT2 family glycosyltransferase